MKINIVTVGVNESHVSDVIKQVKDIEEKHNVDCTITVNTGDTTLLKWSYRNSCMLF